MIPVTVPSGYYHGTVSDEGREMIEERNKQAASTAVNRACESSWSLLTLQVKRVLAGYCLIPSVSHHVLRVPG